jgi:hypothetical protein
MTTTEIAERVNARGQYRKRDGTPITAFQVHGRTRNYPELFERAGSRVGLKSAGSPRTRYAPQPPVGEPGEPGERPPQLSDLEVGALEAISQPGLSVTDARVVVPRGRGLYALRTSAEGSHDLGLEPDLGIIYIGKAERSLRGRDLGQHFADGKTGWSTLRRSLAALLAEDLDLTPMPRNPTKPGAYDRFALEPESDTRLTAWMIEHLRIAFWPAPSGIHLGLIEEALISRLAPPLNLTFPTPDTHRIKSARAAMARRAMEWTLRS